MTSPGSAPNWRGALAVGLIGLAFYAVGISGGSHFDSDDTLYAQMAREMVRTGDFVDNRWSGVVLFEKPPLYLWALAAAGGTLGWSEWSLRLPGTLFAVLALVSLYWLVLGLGGSRRQALTTAALLAATGLFVLLTRRLMTDMALLGCALAAAAALVHGRTVWFGLFAGLAVLAKGPAAAPLLLAAVLWGLFTRTLGWKALGLATGIGLLVAAPWHLIEWQRHGEAFWSAYLFHHVGDRASSNVVPGSNLSEIMNILLGEIVLVGFAAVGLVMAGVRRWSVDSEGRARTVRVGLLGFGLLWTMLALLPVLVSATRLPHYLLPTLPGLALLATSWPARSWWQHRLTPLIAGAAVVMALVASPATLAFWLDPDFGPEHQRLGRTISEHAGRHDLVATYNTTTAALTFYADRPVLMAGDDPQFNAVQQTVLMVRMSGLHVVLEDRADFPKSQGHVFVVARKVDLAALVGRLVRSGSGPLSAVVLDRLVLVNDAGVGTPVDAIGTESET